MAFHVTCPNCGARPYTEFWFGGELVPHASHIAGDTNRLEDDFDRVWMRANAAGDQRERWFHHAGCRRWHVTERNTLTNELHVSG